MIFLSKEYCFQMFFFRQFSDHVGKLLLQVNDGFWWRLSDAPAFFHPNVSSNGIVSSSILYRDQSWHPSMTLKQILISIQRLLKEPDVDNPIQPDACGLYCTNRSNYEQCVRRSIKHAGKYIEFCSIWCA